MTLSLSAEGVTHLEGGRWQTTAAYRFVHAEDGYAGVRFDPTYARTIGAKVNIHSFDIQTTYGFTNRYSMTLTVPFVSGGISSFRDHENDGIHRHTISASGLGMPGCSVTPGCSIRTSTGMGTFLSALV
jgi:hypothetical protein